MPTEVTLVDGDGTSRFFTWTRRAPPIRRTGSTAAPAGAHLLLQKHLGGDAARAWVMTKPDRTQFFFDSDGYSSAVVDRNGNTQTFTHEQRRSANQPDKFLRYVGMAGEASLDDHASTSFSEMCHAVVSHGLR